MKTLPKTKIVALKRAARILEELRESPEYSDLYDHCLDQGGRPADTFYLLNDLIESFPASNPLNFSKHITNPGVASALINAWKPKVKVRELQTASGEESWDIQYHDGDVVDIIHNFVPRF